MIHDSLKLPDLRARPIARKAGGRISRRVRDLAEAGASGTLLTGLQIREICEALRAQTRSVRNQFHSGT